MENDLEFKYDEIIEFLDNIDLTKDNIMEIVEFVYYKTIMDSFTYVIESSKNNSDTGFLAVEYIKATKKLGDVIEKIKEKHDRRIIKEHNGGIESIETNIK